jgi:hypothetical protein
MPQLPNLTGPAVPPEQAAGIRVGVPSTSGLQAIAQAVGSVGEEMHAAKMEILQEQNKIDVLRTESEYGAFMEAEQQKLNFNNPSSWDDQLTKASKAFKDSLASKNLSADAMSSLNTRLMAYEQKIMRSAQRDARLAQVQIISGEFQNRQDSYLKNRDYEGAIENLKESAYSLKMQDHEVESRVSKIREQQTLDALQDAAYDGNVAVFEKDIPGISKAQQRALKSSAESALAKKKRNQSIAAMDGIYANSINTKEDILRVAPDLGAAQTAKLLGVIEGRDSDERNRIIATPEYQKQLIGNVSALIRDYDPNAEDADANFINILDLSEQIESSNYKDHLQNQIEDIRNEVKDKIKTKKDYMFNEVDELFKQDLPFLEIPKEPIGKALGTYLEEGILEDPVRLNSFGFKNEHAQAIAKAAKEEQAAKMDEDETYKGPSSVDLFRRYYSSGEKAVEDFSLKERKVLEAIFEYKGPTTMIVDPPEKQKYERELNEYEKQKSIAYGSYKARVSQWIRLNPDFTIEKADEYIKSLNIDIEGLSESKSNLVAPRPK